MKKETIKWRELPQDRLPDVELTVLCWLDADLSFYVGYWDGKHWRSQENDIVLDGVTHWAVPFGPSREAWHA